MSQLQLSSLDQFNLTNNFNFFSYHKSTGLNRFVPLQVVIEAVDLARQFETCSRSAKSFYSAAVSDIKTDGLRNITDRQITLQHILATGFCEFTLELQIRKFFSIKKIIRLQVAISLFVICGDRGYFCGEFYVGPAKVIRRARYFKIVILELAFDFSD